MNFRNDNICEDISNECNDLLRYTIRATGTTVYNAGHLFREAAPVSQQDIRKHIQSTLTTAGMQKEQKKLPYV